jgi:RNA polymerase sigma factor (sigma-70 family)
LNGAEKYGPVPLGARSQQAESLRKKEEELARLAANRDAQSDRPESNKSQDREKFFEQVIPLLNPLKSYIKRRLRIAYLDLQIRTPVYTSGDILDRIVLRAYEEYPKKPDNLTLEQWLYRIANEDLEKYLHKRKSTDARRRSLETLQQKELSTLEEQPITADADGEPWLPEDLDDSEIPPREVDAPADADDPEKQLERDEEVSQIVRALSHVPERDRIVFELFAVERFSKEEVAKIYDVPPDEVPRIADKVREQLLREIETPQPEKKAS